jgi:hypothetical protein
MADDEIRLRAIIEAEDRSQQVFNDAKKRSEDLVKTQLDLNARLNSSMTTLANGQQKSNMKASEFYAITKDLDKATKSLAEAQKEQAKALHELDRAHDKAARAQATYARQHKSIWEQATADIKGYAGSFVGVAAAVEVVRRSISEFAQFERGMARIEMQTGATNRQMANLGHSVDALARETGQTVAELQKSFQTFSAEMGSGGDDVVKMFKEVQQAAFAAGTSFETMSRTAVTAVKTMNVPMSEIKGMLDTVVKDIPASAMQAWDNVAPRILGIMRSLGATGKDSVGQAANAFGVLSNAMGSAQLAGTVFEQMMKKATSTGDMFGRIMIPQMIALQGQTGGVTKQWEAMYREMERFGIFSENKEQALYMQQKFGFSDEMVRGAQEYHKVYGQIVEAVAKGEAWDTAEKRLVRLSKGPQAAVDDLKGALGELWTVIGSVFGGTIPSELAKMVTGLKNDIERIQAAFAWIRQNVTNTESPTGERFGAGSAGQINQANPNGRGAVGEFLFGGESKPQLKSNPPPTVGGRRTGRYPGAGFATGGSFEVGGEGGIDTTPVGFMATRGERVDVTTPMQESLQQQQDKADIAMREHFARFHDRGTKTGAAPWWPGSSVRAPGAGGPLSGGGGGGGGIPGGSGGAYGGPGGGGGGKDGTGSGGVEPPGTGTTPLKTPVGVDEKSETGPAEDIETAVKRGYLTQAGGTAGGNTSLAAQRVRFATEINNNPALKEKILRISAGENLDNNANRAVFESAMNRAAMMGTTLANEMRITKEGGYYAGYKPNMTAADRKIAEANLAAALGGSNVSNYATENASGSWGEKRMSGGMFTKVYQSGAKGNVELFGIPTGPGARGYDRYAKWKADAEKGQQANVPVEAGGTTAGTASSVLAGVRQGQTLDAEGKVKQSTGEYGPPGVGDVKLLGDSKGVHPELYAVVREASKSLPEGYTARILNGKEARTRGGEHPKGQAADVKIFGPDGKPVGGDEGWYQNPAAFRTYEQFAQRAKEAQVKMYPGGPGFQWGGYFVNKGPGTYGFADAMHMQRGGPAAGGTWEGGAQGPVLEWLKKGGGTSIGISGKVATQGANSISVKTALTPAEAAAEQKRLAEIEQRAKDTFTKAVERSKAPIAAANNKPANAPTNTKDVTDHPAGGEKAAGKNLGGGGDTSVPVRRMPNPPGQEDRAAGKGTKVAAATPHPVSPQADPIPARQWGGSVRGGRSYTVGESGPETFTPAGPGEVKPGTDNYARWMKLPKSSNIEDRRGDMYDTQTGEPMALHRNPPSLSSMYDQRTGAHIGQGGSPLKAVYGHDPGAMNRTLNQYHEMVEEMQKPIRPVMEMPRAGPIRQRMSRHVESQRERDVGRMTRHASHSDIGFA